MKHLDHEDSLAEAEEAASWEQENWNKYALAAAAMTDLANNSLDKLTTLKVEALNVKAATEFTDALNGAKELLNSSIETTHVVVQVYELVLFAATRGCTAESVQPLKKHLRDLSVLRMATVIDPRLYTFEFRSSLQDVWFNLLVKLGREDAINIQSQLMQSCKWTLENPWFSGNERENMKREIHRFLKNPSLDEKYNRKKRLTRAPPSAEMESSEAAAYCQSLGATLEPGNELLRAAEEDLAFWLLQLWQKSGEAWPPYEPRRICVRLPMESMRLLLPVSGAPAYVLQRGIRKRGRRK